MLTGYDVCCMYRSLRLHFTNEKYDYKTYSGKVKYSFQQYETNKSRMLYEKLAGKYTRKDVYFLILANLVDGDDVWIYDLANSPEALNRYMEFLKRNQSLSYIFSKELETILVEKDVFKVNDDFPLLLKMYFRNEICVETLIILNSFMEFLPKWEKNITDDIKWPKTRLKIVKYGKLFNFDKPKFKNLIKSKLEKTL